MKRTNADRLSRDLGLAALRYLEVRAEFTMTKMSEGPGQALTELDQLRTRAHDALISSFNSCLRNLHEKPADMVAAAEGGRVAIGRWAIERAARMIVESG